MKYFVVSVPSQKKLNTYGVESPCGCLPGVGSFLANPGLSKEQLVPSCVVVTFAMANAFIGIMVQYLRRYVLLQVLFANKLCTMVLRFYLHYYLTHVK